MTIDYSKIPQHVLFQALQWALENGANINSSGRLHDGGCGCCSDDLGLPPEELREAINLAGHAIYGSSFELDKE